MQVAQAGAQAPEVASLQAKLDQLTATHKEMLAATSKLQVGGTWVWVCVCGGGGAHSHAQGDSLSDTARMHRFDLPH